MMRNWKSGQVKPVNRRALSSETPLQSWKEIAVYLERTERTARRWEKSAGLPVRRHHGGPRSTVYAYRSELDAWRVAHGPKSGQTHLLRWSVPAAIGALSIVLGAWFIVYGPVFNPPNPLVEAANGITVRQVWTGPEVDSSGRPSPDGRYLSCRIAGNLGVRELDSGETRLLTHDAGWGEHPYDSVFSPDGLQIVYEWGRRVTELRLVDLNGSQPRVLYPREPGWWVEPVDWSADGRFILVRHYTGDPPHSYQIGIVSVVDGSLSILKTVSCRNRINLWFSPDGSYIVYDHSSQGDLAERDISVIGVAGDSEFSLVEYPGDDYVLGWTPDGGSVLITSNRSGSYDAWLIPVIEGRPGGKPVPLKRNIGPIHSLGFTPDGSFYYEQSGGDWDNDIYTVDVDFEEARLLGSPRLAVRKQTGNNWSPEWSPEGDFMAYVSKHTDSTLLCIRNEQTGEEEQLKLGLSRLSLLRWSPDGGAFLVSGVNLEGHRGWFVVDRNTANVTSVPIPKPGGAVFDVQWISDGKSILYGRSKGTEYRSQIAQLDLETGRVKELLRLEGEGLLGFVALSPGGTRLAFTRWRLDEPGTEREKPKSISLLVRPVAGGHGTELLSVEFPEVIGQLAWSSDDRFLIFGKTLLERSGEGTTELWRIEPDQGRPEQLGVLGNLMAREPIRIHPKKGRIAFTRAEKRAEIWAMEGFLPTEVASN